MNMAYWEGKGFSFFSNRDCEYFPCHSKGDPESFNCMFCFCPLYSMGDDCGGDFCYLDNGYKDCSACLLPHVPENYGFVIDKLARKCREKGEACEAFER